MAVLQTIITSFSILFALSIKDVKLQPEDLVNTEREVAKCGAIIGLSVNLNEFLISKEENNDDKLKIIVKNAENGLPSCGILLDEERCLPSRCRQELCDTLDPGEEEVLQYILKESVKGEWVVACEIFRIEEIKLPTQGRLSDDPRMDRNKNNYGDAELLPYPDQKSWNEACKELFNKNRTDFWFSDCCFNRNGDPRCLLAQAMLQVERSEKEGEAKLGTIFENEEVAGVRKKEMEGSYRGGYYTLLVFFFVFLAIFLLIIVFLIFKLKSSNLKTMDSSQPREISHRRFSECLPVTPTPSAGSQRKTVKETTSFLFPSAKKEGTLMYFNDENISIVNQYGDVLQETL